MLDKGNLKAALWFINLKIKSGQNFMDFSKTAE